MDGKNKKYKCFTIDIEVSDLTWGASFESAVIYVFSISLPS